MRAALVWRGESENSDGGVGAVVDAILSRAGAYDDGGGGRKGRLPKKKKKKNRGCAPERIAAAVEGGGNPFFVSLRPNTAVGGVRAKAVVAEKSAAADGRGKGRGNERKRVEVEGKKRLKAAAAAATAAPVPLHSRRLTSRKLRSMCGGTTKATALFRLFKTESLEGESRRVRSVRRREGRREPGGASRIVAAFWSAVAAVVQQRNAYKRLWCELWETRSVGSDDEPSQVRLLRSFPLFGLAVEVQRLRWQRRADGSWSAAEVVDSTPGVVMHESSAFLGVVLLRDGWACLQKSAGLQPHADAADAAAAAAAASSLVCSGTEEDGPLAGRVLRVAKAFPGGTGAAEDIHPTVDATCIVAMVASEEADDAGIAFKQLVGRYL